MKLATEARKYYKEQIAACKQALADAFTINGELEIPPISSQLLSCSNTLIVHLSFDMAQQVRMLIHKVLLLNTQSYMYRFTIQVILSSQGQCIFLRPENVLFSESAVKQSLDRCVDHKNTACTKFSTSI